MTHPDNTAPVVYLPHGGGPLPLLGDSRHEELISFLGDVGTRLGTPAAILVISAHWEETMPTLTSGSHPRLIYDYAGFPEQCYKIEYPAPGSPGLAKVIHEELFAAGFDPVLDPDRGYDHGVFVPLTLLYPDADIPCLQLSLLDSLDPADHIRLGQAISALRKKDVLVVGSGMSYHNMDEFSDPTEEGARANREFDFWLVDTCTSGMYESEERQQKLVDWVSAPGARLCHPREEHLLPLHVCFGIVSEENRGAEVAFSGEVLGRKVTALIWN